MLRLAIYYENNIATFIKDYKKSALENHTLDLSSKSVAVLGRGLTAGFPISLILLKCNADLSIFHSKSGDFKDKTKESDIIVSCIGTIPKIIDEKFIKKDAIIIDVGINININTSTGVKEITGDVNFDKVLEKAKYITPMPGGIGRITVIMLIRNVIKSWKRNYGDWKR